MLFVVIWPLWVVEENRHLFTGRIFSLATPKIELTGARVSYSPLEAKEQISLLNLEGLSAQVLKYNKCKSLQ